MAVVHCKAARLSQSSLSKARDLEAKYEALRDAHEALKKRME